MEATRDTVPSSPMQNETILPGRSPQSVRVVMLSSTLVAVVTTLASEPSPSSSLAYRPERLERRSALEVVPRYHPPHILGEGLGPLLRFSFAVASSMST